MIRTIRPLDRGFCTRSGSVLCQRTEMMYRTIDRCRHAFLVQMMCHHLRISTSEHPDWRGRPAGSKSQANAKLLEKIRRVTVSLVGAKCTTISRTRDVNRA
jgi:hypothetical protein